MGIKMNGVSNIIKKELARVFKDKKLVVSLFILPGILIIGLYTLIGKMQMSMVNDIEKHISNISIQNAPEGFEHFVKEQMKSDESFRINITYLPENHNTEQVKDMILHGTADAFVVFEPDFLTQVRNYKEGDNIPDIKTYYNPSEDYSKAARTTFLEKVINPYQKMLLSQRIGNLESILVFTTDVNPESSVIIDEEKAAGKLLGMMLPYFITMLLFAGAMSLGVDAITGEKERGTLASMLITPIKRSEIVMGKLISLSILSSLSAAVYAISMVIAMPMMMGFYGDNTDNMVMNINLTQIVQLLIIMLTLVFLYVTIVCLAAVFAKTSKEASTYVSPMYIIVIVAGLITMFQNGEASLVSYGIPIYGSAIAMQSLFVGELTMIKFVLTLLGTIGSSAVLTCIITKAFNSEKVMFNA